MRRFYWHEIANRAQLLKIVTSMGIFGNISDTLGSLVSAFKSLVHRPFETEDNRVKAVLFGSLVSMKEAIMAVSGSVGSVLDSLRQGIVFVA
jgi:hypothetical protein